ANKDTKEGLAEAHIRILNNKSVNELVGRLISEVELVSFSENIPSFNDIFIRAVGGEIVGDL
ncbi:MAG: DUF4162 domain-containing protein, partial [Runella slithyformis]